MASAAKIPVVFILNDKALKKAEAGLKHLGTASVNLGKQLFALAGAVGIEEIARRSVNAAVTMEKATTKLNQSLTNMGQSAKIGSEELKKTNDAMINLGFSGADSATSLATLVTATGDLAKAQSYMGVTADLARRENITLGDSADKIAKLANGNAKGFDKFGVSLDKTLPKAQRITLAFEQLTSAIGNEAARYAQTYAGRLDILKAKFEEMQVSVGEALLPILLRLSDILVVIADTISTYITPVIDRLGNAFAPIGAKISKGIVPAFEKIVAGAKAMWDYMYPLIHAVFEAIPPIIDAARAAFTKIGEAFSKNSEKLKPLSNMLNTFYNFAKDRLIPFIRDYMIASFTALGDIISWLAPYITKMIAGAVGQMQLFLNIIIKSINAIIRAKNFLFGTSTKQLGEVDFFGKTTKANTTVGDEKAKADAAIERQYAEAEAIKWKDAAAKRAAAADSARQKKLAAEAKKRTDAAAAAEAKKKQLSKLQTQLAAMFDLDKIQLAAAAQSNLSAEQKKKVEALQLLQEQGNKTEEQQIIDLQNSIKYLTSLKEQYAKTTWGSEGTSKTSTASTSSPIMDILGSTPSAGSIDNLAPTPTPGKTGATAPTLIFNIPSADASPNATYAPGSFAKGIEDPAFAKLKTSSAPSAMAAAMSAPSGMGGNARGEYSGATVNVTVQGSVTSESSLVDNIYNALNNKLRAGGAFYTNAASG